MGRQRYLRHSGKVYNSYGIIISLNILKIGIKDE
jgi:hypothetical protein